MFEILSQYVAQNDWAAAFNTVIPARKYEAIGKQGQRRRKREECQVAEAGAEITVPPHEAMSGAADETIFSN